MTENNKYISKNSHKILLLKIETLKAEKANKEMILRNSFQDFASSLNPITIVKDSLHELAKDKTVQVDLAKVGLNLGTNFLIDQTLGKYRSIKGFVGSMLLEKFTTSFINNNSSKILSGISNLLSRKSK